MSKIRIVRRVSIFLFLLLLMTAGIQAVSMPDWSNNGDPKAVLRGFRGLDDDSVSVLFLGSSHIYDGISPMRLYIDNGIVAYSMGTSAQPIESSYYLLRSAFESQLPELVLLEANFLFRTSDPSNYWRYILDSLPLSVTKMELAMAYTQNAEEADSFSSVLFPLIKYHTRFPELTSADFEFNRETIFSAGEQMLGYCFPTYYTKEQVDYWEDWLHGQISAAGNQRLPGIEYSVEISQYNLNWLQKMKELCAKNGSRLILLTLPMRTVPQNTPSSWSGRKSKLVGEVAKEFGLDYIDLQEAEIGLDFTTDTFDAGNHLNTSGAVKVSAYLGTIFRETYQIPPSRNALYDEAVELYEKVERMCLLSVEKNIARYFDSLAVNKYHAQGAPRRMKTVVRRATIKAHGTRLLSLCRFERDKQISLCSPVEPQIVPASLRGRGRIAK